MLQTNRKELLNSIKGIDSLKSIVYLDLQKDLSFNDYIDLKSRLINLNSEYIQIAK